MSKIMNGGRRRKSARESYVEQLPYNHHKQRKSFTRLHSVDDTDVAYRSAPEYLRQLMNTSTLSNGSSARSVTRTYSASEMTPQNRGNPKYKAQEDYYDEIQLFKKELKYVKDDNSNLRAKIRRLEEDNARKRKEMDNLYDTNKDGDQRRTSTGSSTPTGNVVMNLKQRLFKLELQLRQKETTIDELKNDPRWTKGTELEIQNRALFNELEKQKFERLNYIQNDYMAAIDQEKKNVVRKLDMEKRELKIENESLKKKVHELEKSERSGELSARHRDGSIEKDPFRKIEKLKELCKNYENEIDEMKDHLRQMRRERDKYRDKFDNINEDLKEIKRERDQYRQKLDRINNDFDGGRYERDRQTKFNQTGRSSPAFKRDEGDSRSTLAIRKANEHISPRSSLLTKKPSRNWTSEDDRRVKKFREKHAATVIQRGWRKHNKLHKHSLMNKTRQNNFDQRNSRIGGFKPSSEIQSPRGSQQKLGSKVDNLGSGTIKNRPLSASIANESALKIVQASLRGLLNRTGLDKTSQTQKSLHNISDDEDIITTSARQYGKQDNFLNHSKQNFGDHSGLRHDKLGSNNRFPTSNRDSPSKLHRSSSPPLDSYRSSSPHMSGGSKQTLPNDRNKIGFENRFSMNDREPSSKTMAQRRTPSPPIDIHRSSSPHFGNNIGSKQSLPNDKNKFGPINRIDRESSLKLQRPSSPLNDHRSSRHISPENTRPASRQTNTSLRKSPTNSKQSLRNTFHDDDDDDIIGS